MRLGSHGRTFKMAAMGVLLVRGILGCDGGGCSGCDCVTPLEAPFPPERKVYDGIQARITPTGFDFIEGDLGNIIAQFMPGGLTFDVPPSDVDQGILFTGTVCPTPCPITATINDATLARTPPNQLPITIIMDLDGTIHIEGTSFFLPFTCNVDLVIRDKPVTVDVFLLIDPLTKHMTVDVANPQVEITSDDIVLSDGLCGLVELISFLKDLLVGFLAGGLTDQLQGVIDDQLRENTCWKCADAPGGCPVGSACDADGFCINDGTVAGVAGECVATPLGLMGSMDLGSALAGISPSTEAELDLFIVTGSDDPNEAFIDAPNGPLNLGVIGGLDSEASDCVPETTAPPTGPVPELFEPAYPDLIGPPFNNCPDTHQQVTDCLYDVGIGISDVFLDNALWSAFNGGTLCLAIQASELSNGLLTSGTLQLLVPDLRKVAPDPAPVILVIRPESAPSIDVGAGILDHSADPPEIVEPLLKVFLDDFAIDFHVLVDGRYIRIFTVTMDIEVPVGLDFTPDNEIMPIIGDLSEGMSDVRVTNNEMLDMFSDDPVVLENLFKTILAVALPSLSESLSAIEIPPMEGFVLNVLALRGEIPLSGTDPQLYEQMALFATLAFEAQAGTPLRYEAPTPVHLARVDVPPAEEFGFRPGGHPPVTPSITLELLEETLEYQYRLDGLGWSPFFRGREYTIRHPLLLLKGRHRLEVRARDPRDYHTLDSSPEVFEVLIDPVPARVEVVGGVFDSGRAGLKFGHHGRTDIPDTGCSCTALWSTVAPRGALASAILFMLAMATLVVQRRRH